DVGKLAVVVVVVQAVSDDEEVGDLEAGVVGLEGNHLPSELPEQHCRLQRLRAQLLHVSDDLRERVAAVQNVVNQQDVPTLDVRQQPFVEDLQVAGDSGFAAVAAGAQEADARGQLQRPD